ncbi:PREDICTED: uncharacterized protein LOC105367980 [Ceratosolen solmsi marchali]|uniref:Uncharacterized protein LOC105367980 n=1 Tax=Ceratosolen solmsi marchali TaxID=326594 RepID=A0AAJ6YVK8_9HYME|nr:PREDICTED: uncharacterized protein LOC105367980 [Ceratosolen solmsi marchali]
MCSSRSLLILGIFFVVNCRNVHADVNDTIWKGFSVMCMSDENNEIMNLSVSCHGVKLVRKIVQKFLEEFKKKRNLEILDGVSLVKSDIEDVSSRNGRALNRFGQIGSMVKLLENRELRIKLPSLLPENFESAIEESLPSTEQGRKSSGGFGGGKKGDGGVMMMALMMGKMMAAMGFGALALLAMKALMVSSLALMLSLIIAAKKLASGKEEDSHHVVYAQEISSSHHRRRRSPDNIFDDFKMQPYQGYMIVPTELQKLRS